ncbi:MAG: LytTR family DNA-binding domain-containing protein [Pseudomonadota bacterium]
MKIIENASASNLVPESQGALNSLKNYFDARPVMTSFLAMHLGFAAIYFIVFQITRLEPFSTSLQGALINTIPLMSLSAGVIWLLHKFALGRPKWRHIAAHPVLATVFTFAWYFIVLIGRGFNGNWLENGFTIEPFIWIAGVWQLYQGIALYVFSATFAYAAYYYERAKHVERFGSEGAQAIPVSVDRKERLIIRSGREYLTFDYEDIFYLEANGDEVKLRSRTGTTKTSKSLSSLADALPTPPFVRIHRSYIINIENVQSAEPAGNGRLTIHLSNGTSLITSRAGARAFREHVD